VRSRDQRLGNEDSERIDGDSETSPHQLVDDKSHVSAERFAAAYQVGQNSWKAWRSSPQARQDVTPSEQESPLTFFRSVPGAIAAGSALAVVKGFHPSHLRLIVSAFCHRTEGCGDY